MGLSALRSQQGLSAEQQAQVQKLRARDTQVHAHEMAHMAVGGQYASAPHYVYQTGPDGQRYAVGGEVNIDASAVRGDAEATARKMEQVVRAALAPADPSPQDRAVAASARQRAAQARSQALRQQQQESQQARDKDVVQRPAQGGLRSDSGQFSVRPIVDTLRGLVPQPSKRESRSESLVESLIESRAISGQEFVCSDKWFGTAGHQGQLGIARHFLGPKDQQR